MSGDEVMFSDNVHRYRARRYTRATPMKIHFCGCFMFFVNAKHVEPAYFVSCIAGCIAAQRGFHPAETLVQHGRQANVMGARIL